MLFKRMLIGFKNVSPALCLAALLAGGCALSRPSTSTGASADGLPLAPVSPASATTDTLVASVPDDRGTAETVAPPRSDNPVVLVVNGIEVRLSEYREGLRDYLRANGDGSYSSELEESYHRRLIDDLLLYDYGRRVGAEQEADYRLRLLRLQRQLLIEYVRRTRILSQVRITPEDIQKYYEAHGTDFATPGMVQVRAIQTSNFRDAETVLNRVKANPQDFDQVARQYSIHPSRNRGGELEPFARDTYAKPFEDVAFNLEIGEISPIIATEQGYFIIEKLGEIPEQRPSLDEVKSLIEERLRAQKEDEVLGYFLSTLRQYGAVESHWPSVGNGGSKPAEPKTGGTPKP